MGGAEGGKEIFKALTKVNATAAARRTRLQRYVLKVHQKLVWSVFSFETVKNGDPEMADSCTQRV